MSLINEALKRARVEAARRDAAAKGVPPAALPVYVPRRRRPWVGPLVGFLAGLAAVVVAVVAFSLVRGAEPAPASPAAPSAAPVEAASPSPPPPAAPQRADTPARDAATAPPPPAVAPPPPAVAPPPAPAPAGSAGVPPAGRSQAPEPSPPAAEAIREPPPPPGPAPRPAAPAAPATSDEGRSFRREAQVAGGGKIKLEFIVWSETRPFAQLNGKQVSPGQTVDGYKLLEVERERVRLERGGRTFWLRVR